MFLLVSMLAAACTSPTACVSRPPTNAVIVEIRDSITARPLAAGATVTIQDGSFSATSVGAGDTLTAAYVGLGGARPGKYKVTVERPAYQRWTKSNVIALRTACDVQSAVLLVRLVAN